MIEATVIAYLNNRINVSVYAEMPENKPDKFIIVEKTGSSRVNRVNHATIALQSYAPSMLEASELNEEVKEVMDGIIILSNISSSRLNSDYNFTNSADKRYRYQAVYELTY